MPRAFKKAGTFQRNAWTKMFGKKRHRVHCEDLGLPRELWTELGSYQAAIEHWEKLFAEKSPVLDPINQQLATILDGTTPDDLRRLANQGAEARRVLTILEAASVDGKSDTVFASPDEFGPIGKTALPVAELAELPIPQRIITTALTDGVFDDDEDVATMRIKQVAKTLAKPKIETSFTLRHQADKFLTRQRARDKRATTYAELKRYTDKLVEMAGAELDVRTINESTIETTYLKLKAFPWQERTRRKTWMIFLRLVEYFFKARMIELPRNLDDFDFKIIKKKIKRYSKQEVREELNSLPDRLRLYALLGLNCGMLGVDMASFTWDELDKQAWRITRKRTKTGENDNVPTVTYKLWPETISLLKKNLSDHPTYVLASRTGTLLWKAWTDESTGKPKKKDLIVLQWKRQKNHKIKLKDFRSIGATVIADEKEKGYGRYVGHYLGHSPKSLTDIHYTPPSDELFEEILAYLGRELGLA
jgi:hypothetical protein